MIRQRVEWIYTTASMVLNEETGSFSKQSKQAYTRGLTCLRFIGYAPFSAESRIFAVTLCTRVAENCASVEEGETVDTYHPLGELKALRADWCSTISGSTGCHFALAKTLRPLLIKSQRLSEISDDHPQSHFTHEKILKHDLK